MARPKVDDCLPPGVYPADGTIGYPTGTGTLDPPYEPGYYPVPSDDQSCSSPIGCPQGVGIIVSPDPDPLGLYFSINHVDAVHQVRWDFGDGTQQVTAPSNEQVFHVFPDDGTYTVKAVCHAQIGDTDVTVPTGGPVPGLTLTVVDPDVWPVDGQFRVWLTGTGFKTGMVVRVWDGAGEFRGAIPVTTVNTPTEAVVDLDTTGWTAGTGGIDVYLNDAWSDPQLQVTIGAALTSHLSCTWDGTGWQTTFPNDLIDQSVEDGEWHQDTGVFNSAGGTTIPGEPAAVNMFWGDDSNMSPIVDLATGAMPTQAFIEGVLGSGEIWYRYDSADDRWEFSTAAAAAWTPAAIPGLTAWYDAADDASFTYSSGDVVAGWADLSGNGHDMTQTTPALQPSRSGDVNGLPSVVFSAHRLATPSYGMTKPHTTLLVAHNTATDGQREAVMLHSDGRVFRVAAGTIDLYQQAFLSSGEQWGTTAARTVVAVFNGATSKIAVDGGPYTVGDGGGNATIDGGFHALGSFSEGQGLWQGDICEVALVEGEISADDLAEWWSYCFVKWGVPAS